MGLCFATRTACELGMKIKKKHSFALAGSVSTQVTTTNLVVSEILCLGGCWEIAGLHGFSESVVARPRKH